MPSALEGKSLLIGFVSINWKGFHTRLKSLWCRSLKEALSGSTYISLSVYQFWSASPFISSYCALICFEKLDGGVSWLQKAEVYSFSHFSLCQYTAEMKKLIETTEFVMTTIWRVSITYTATLHNSATSVIMFFHVMTGVYTLWKSLKHCNENEYKSMGIRNSWWPSLWSFSPVESIQLIFTLILLLVCLRLACVSI